MDSASVVRAGLFDWRRLSVVFLACVLTAALSVSACGGGGGTTPTPATKTPTTTAMSFSGSVGASGGTVGAITNGTGIEMTIPAGALSQTIMFTVTPIASPVAGALGQVYDIEPSSTQFAVPITLKFPHTTAELGSVAPTAVVHRGDVLLELPVVAR